MKIFDNNGRFTQEAKDTIYSEALRWFAERSIVFSLRDRPAPDDGYLALERLQSDVEASDEPSSVDDRTFRSLDDARLHSNRLRARGLETGYSIVYTSRQSPDKNKSFKCIFEADLFEHQMSAAKTTPADLELQARVIVYRKVPE